MKGGGSGIRQRPKSILGIAATVHLVFPSLSLILCLTPEGGEEIFTSSSHLKVFFPFLGRREKRNLLLPPPLSSSGKHPFLPLNEGGDVRRGKGIGHYNSAAPVKRSIAQATVEEREEEGEGGGARSATQA